MRQLFAIITLLLCTLLPSAAQLVEPTAKMSVSIDSVMIGDTLSLWIDIEKDLAQEISIPTFKDNRLTEKIEIVNGPKLDTLSQNNRTINLRVNYTITSFDAGGYVLDSFPVLVGNKEPFDTIFAIGGDLLKVGTFDIDTTRDAAADIRDIVEAPYGWAEFKQWVAQNWWIIALVVVALGGIGFGVWYYLRSRRAKREAAAAIPPHQRAIDSLEKLRNQKLWQNGRMKEYFSAITDILRTYIEQRYGVQALEMTSAEILHALKELNDSDTKLIGSMRELLDVADLAKFAKASPSAEECETAYFDAYYYIEQTKEAEEIQPDQTNQEVK